MPVQLLTHCPGVKSGLLLRIERCAGILLRAAGRSELELNIILVDDSEIAGLNRKWLGRPWPTNVISFGGTKGALAEAPERILGDIVISVDAAKREAGESGRGFWPRLEALLIHGLVHLLGEDHEKGSRQAERMTAKERELKDILLKEHMMADLCINVDHVATVREARGITEPDPVLAAGLVELAGADGVVVHLREDRRHIKDRDVKILRQTVKSRLTLEMAATDEMIRIASGLKPDIVTLVPEKREELTTEGGLDVIRLESQLSEAVHRLHDAGIPVSLFVDPETGQIEASGRTGAECLEIHTGRYADATSVEIEDREFEQIVHCARLARDLDLRVHAGHGLNYRNTGRLAAVSEIEEFSIGHAVVARAVLVGIERAVREMLSIVKNGTIV